ncbi:MAG: glutamate--tRNA ligase [Thermoplasmata archaeon]
MNEESIYERAYIYALKNALDHKRKANDKAVMGKIIQEFPELKANTAIASEICKKASNKVNSLSEIEFDAEIEKFNIKSMEIEHAEKKHTLPDLPGAEKGKVVMRMAPFPSGALHIGNSRMIILNDEYVKMYNGKLLLVYDDTIGSEEKIPLEESYSMIEEDLKWMGVKYDHVYYKSDRMDIFYQYGEELIKKGSAYVCFCNQEELKHNREKGIECLHRNHTVEENMKFWKDMIENRFNPGQAIVRIKTSMTHPNPAFRDRVLFRIANRAHPRVGNKYTVWPLLEFSWAIDDVLLGVTHVLRGKDLWIEDEMEKYIWNILGWKGPVFIHYGMLRIAEAKLSKSKFMKEVTSGAFIGWEDPRTWSLRSLKKRGFSPESIRKFVLSFGLSLTDIEVPAENLYSENRKMIDAISPRYMYVENPVLCVIENLPGEKNIETPLSPDNPAMGKKTLYGKNEVYIPQEDFEAHRGEVIRLKDFVNVLVSQEGNVLTFDSWENKKIPRIQWVSKGHELPCNVIYLNGSTKKGLVEECIKDRKIDTVVQFERYGFVKIDSISKLEISVWFTHP